LNPPLISIARSYERLADRDRQASTRH
jgi:hypothetical protein